MNIGITIGIILLFSAFIIFLLFFIIPQPMPHYSPILQAKSICKTQCSKIQEKIRNVPCDGSESCFMKYANRSYNNYCKDIFSIGQNVYSCKDLISCKVRDVTGKEIKITCK